MSDVFAASIDLGTMFICSIRDDGQGNTVTTSSRNCYRELAYVEEFEDQLKAQKCQFMRDGDKLYVLGDQAYVQAGMAEVAADIRGSGESLCRPMRDGILNPDSPKTSLIILRELMRGCIEKGIGPAREGEILYFSVPANPADSKLNNTFHAKMAERYLNSLGFDARPLGEGLAVLFAENPKMHSPDGDVPFTGCALSFGAGMVNFCLAERGVPMDEFSLCRSGDWLDEQVARMTGQPKTKVMRVKEKKLDFNKIDETAEDGDILLAYDIYYDELVNYVFTTFAKRFKGNRGNIEHPIDVVVSGGTASPPGFDKKMKKILSKLDFPFEIHEVRLAGNGDRKKMLAGTAAGCYLRAKQAARKVMSANEILDK